MSGEVVWGLKPGYSAYLSASATVANDGRLTIRPGTVVKFAQYAGLWVDGHLDAPGTSALPIHFTDWRDDAVGGDANGDGTESSVAPAWWRGVYVRAVGSATLAHGSTRYAGYWDSVGFSKTGSGNLTLSHWTISQINGHGMVVENSTGTTSLQECAFSNSSQSGLYLRAGPVTATGCAFTGNTQYGVLLDASDGFDFSANAFSGNSGGSVGVNAGTVAVDRTWSRGVGDVFTVVIRGALTVAASTTLTIEPGVTVQAAQYAPLLVEGTLKAVGTAGSPIGFEGLSGAKNWWRGIQLSGAGSAQLDWCDVAHAGYWDGVGLLAAGTGSLSLKNSTIRDHQGDGLRLAAGYARLTSQNNSFRNADRGVRLGVGASWDDVTSVFAGNGIDLHLDAGTMSGEVVWGLKPAYSAYLSGSATIASEGRLTIRPGTVVKCARYAGLYVDGHLDAPGTSVLPIYFTDWRDDAVGGDANGDGTETSAAPGWWRGMYVRVAGSATLVHGTTRYGGYWDSVGFSKTGSGSLSLSRWTISQVNGHGMAVDSSTGTTRLEECTFSGNSQAGLYLKAAPVTATGCAFTGNAQYGVLQEAGEALDFAANSFSGNTMGSVGINGGTVAVDRTWSRGVGEPFTVVIRGALTVAPSTTLTIQPGVTVQVAQYAPLLIAGMLKAEGTAGSPIGFGGTTATKGWWRGLQMTGAGSAQMAWCDVAHAGYWDSVGVFKSGSGALSLNHSTLRDHAGDGLRLDGSTGTHAIDQCRFTGNANGVLVRNLAAPITLGHARIEANTAFGVRNYGPAEVDARQAWWGHASGPRHSTRNPDGQGNEVSDLVLFEPWSTGLGTGSGSLQVWVEPEDARAAGARWSLDGVNWNDPGVSVGLEAGNHTVQGKPVDGWELPAPQTATLNDGGSVTLTLTYTPKAAGPEFQPGPLLSEARMAHHLVTLPDGRVVVFGGHGTGFRSLQSAAIWSESTGSFTPLTMRYTHDWAAFAALGDGRFLLAGGSADLGIPRYATSEVFDPATGVFTAVGDLVRFRSGSGSAALTGGKVLIAGGWWTHNEAHTYGEVFDPVSGTFTATGALSTRRAHPVVVPTADGGALVLGGTPPTGGALISSVERFDAADGEFVAMQAELFADESGWGLVQESRPVTTQRLADGRSLFLAQRTEQSITRYRLFTVDPQSQSIAVLALTPDLPDSRAHSLWPPVVDAARGRAHLLAQVAGSNPPQLRLFSVDLATGALTSSAQPYVLEPAYQLSGAGVTLLADGRLFVTGGSEDGSNFKPVRHTLLIAPPTTTTAPSLRVVRTATGAIQLVWSAGPGAFVVETSVNLSDWSVLPDTPIPVDGGLGITVSFDPAVRFFRLKSTGS
ncbi:MAG: right-handed parallel beta-helix repeat-containing protein [Limisphaerales bacterium]